MAEDERLDVARIEKMGLWQRILHLLYEGFSDSDVREQLRLEPDEYDRLRREAFEFEADRIRQKSSEEIYVEYMINQGKCIKDLTDLASQFVARKHYSALVTAVRARSQIYDKVIEVGQNFGIIEKAPDRSEKNVKLLIGKLEKEEIAKMAVGELQNMDRLMKMIGDEDILDVSPGRIHRALPAPKTGKKDRAKQNRVHKGRRVVKGGKRKGSV